jgi:hypothetical protein
MRFISLSALLSLALSGCTITTMGRPISYTSRPVVAANVSANVVASACDAICGAPAGCRTAIHRAYHPGSGEHFYTATRGEGAALGYNEEAANYFYLSSAPAPGLVPLHRCLMNYGKHFYTTAPNCEGVTPGTEEGTLGYLSTTPQCGAVPLFRSYNPSSNDHFYTTDPAEHARATHGGGWNDEGITGYVWPSAV